jgi:hypothetical protein
MSIGVYTVKAAIYSSRTAPTVSSPIALRKGIDKAITDTISSNADIAAKVAASLAVTPFESFAPNTNCCFRSLSAKS